MKGQHKEPKKLTILHSNDMHEDFLAVLNCLGISSPSLFFEVLACLFLVESMYFISCTIVSGYVRVIAKRDITL